MVELTNSSWNGDSSYVAYVRGESLILLVLAVGDALRLGSNGCASTVGGGDLCVNFYRVARVVTSTLPTPTITHECDVATPTIIHECDDREQHE